MSKDEKSDYRDIGAAISAEAEAVSGAEDEKVEFGVKLNHLIKERGLTNATFKQQLAKTHGIHPTTADNWLHGSSMPRQRALSAIAEVLGVDVPVLTMPLSDLGDKVSFLGTAASPPVTTSTDPVRTALALSAEDERSRQFVGTYSMIALRNSGIGVVDEAFGGLDVSELSVKADRISGLLVFKCSGGAETVSGYVHLSDTCLSLIGTAKPSGDFVTIMLDKFPASWGRGSHTGLYCAPAQAHRGRPVAQPVAALVKGLNLDEAEITRLETALNSETI